MSEVKNFINQFEVLIFDMGKTIMFEGDRFGDNMDYESTYCKIGGVRLKNYELQEIMSHIYGNLLLRSRNPEHLNNMITVREFIDSNDFFNKYDKIEKKNIEAVFANHECGNIPDICKETLIKLSKHFRLGVISNVWSCSTHFFSYFKEIDVFDLFELIIFSSDYGSAKPSKKLFNFAINHFQQKPQNIVYIGDNYKRDVLGSKNAKMKSILIQNGPAGKISGKVMPDYIINGIEELV